MLFTAIAITMGFKSNIHWISLDTPRKVVNKRVETRTYGVSLLLIDWVTQTSLSLHSTELTGSFREYLSHRTEQMDMWFQSDNWFVCCLIHCRTFKWCIISDKVSEQLLMAKGPLLIEQMSVTMCFCTASPNHTKLGETWGKIPLGCLGEVLVC